MFNFRTVGVEYAIIYGPEARVIEIATSLCNSGKYVNLFKTHEGKAIAMRIKPIEFMEGEFWGIVNYLKFGI